MPFLGILYCLHIVWLVWCPPLSDAMALLEIFDDVQLKLVLA
jgi:hypothetical protein